MTREEAIDILDEVAYKHLLKGNDKEEKTMTREEAINQLNKLKSFHNGSYGEAINFAIESIKVDMAYDLAYEKVESEDEE